jgi:hypothetical protein
MAFPRRRKVVRVEGIWLITSITTQGSSDYWCGTSILPENGSEWRQTASGQD